jgi:transposase
MTERELARAAARRLAIIRHAGEVSGNVALTCRYNGISRHTFYKWLRRYEEFGIDGLRDRSRPPHTSPHATSGEVVGKIVYLRKTYHFGPQKISMHLKRYHDLQVSTSGVWRILKRLQMNLVPPAGIEPATHGLGNGVREIRAAVAGSCFPRGNCEIDCNIINLPTPLGSQAWQVTHEPAGALSRTPRGSNRDPSGTARRRAGRIRASTAKAFPVGDASSNRPRNCRSTSIERWCLWLATQDTIREIVKHRRVRVVGQFELGRH